MILTPDEAEVVLTVHESDGLREFTLEFDNAHVFSDQFGSITVTSTVHMHNNDEEIYSNVYDFALEYRLNINL